MAKLTQLELAEKLSFSDKSISKWERGDAIADVTVLLNMCEIFGITLNDLVSEEFVEPKAPATKFRNRFLISMLSAGLVWLVATLVFVSLLIFAPTFSSSYLAFIYAIPVSIIVLLVFGCMWGKKWHKCILVSLLIWTIILSICLTFMSAGIWDLFYIGIPLQVLTILWFMLKRANKQKEEKKTNNG